MKREIKIYSPATVSNIGCGFDVMGFALDEPCEEIIMRTSAEPGIKIKKITGDNGEIPYDIEQNTATKALLSYIQFNPINFGLELEINKKMGLGSGLGSSAASAVSAVYGLNYLLGNPLHNDKLLLFALDGEKIASNAIHADNVAPCLYGGFILIRSYDPIDIIKLPIPPDLYCTVIHPQIEIKTSEARALLGNTVKLKDAITQWGNVGGLISGIYQNDYSLIGRSIKDKVAEPHRSKLIPGYDQIKEAAYESGAIGCNISGSGPAIFALSVSKETAEKVASAMEEACNQVNIENKIYVSKINKNGPLIVE
ncbi:MAG: homoserine kinase [Ignavibacteria bacterium]|nr:homoserine kinase [Ignavibacteria bacterium]